MIRDGQTLWTVRLAAVVKLDLGDGDEVREPLVESGTRHGYYSASGPADNGCWLHVGTDVDVTMTVRCFFTGVGV